MAINGVSDNRLSRMLNRADWTNAVSFAMGCELVETLVPLRVDELSGRRPAAAGSACAPGSSP
jgi:hypothetical protein